MIVSVASVLKFVTNLNSQQSACAMLNDVPEQSCDHFCGYTRVEEEGLLITAIVSLEFSSQSLRLSSYTILSIALTSLRLSAKG